MCQCCPHHIETSQLIWTANQLTDFYMRATLALNGLLNKEETKYPIRKLTIVTIIFYVKKGRFVMKIYFSDNIIWSFKN